MTGQSYGVKRGTFPDGEGTVLVLEDLQDLWPEYSRRVPQECNLLFVRDCVALLKAMRRNPAIGVVIVQGASRKTTHEMVDQLQLDPEALHDWVFQQDRAGQPVYDWLNHYTHTLMLLKTLSYEFEGVVQVVSLPGANQVGYLRDGLRELKDLRVQHMGMHDFFEGSFTSKVEGLWRRIAAYEYYRDGTKRPLRPDSVIDQLLEQAIYPHPAEGRLYERWFGGEQSTMEDVLTWLEDLKREIASGDVRAIYQYTTQLPERRGACECFSSSELAFHDVHDLFNRAVWEIVDMAGLMDWMRLQLELDLASQNPTFPEFGHHMRHDSGLQLREFFRPEGPSEQWTGQH